MSGIVNTMSTLHGNIATRRLVAEMQADLAQASQEASSGFKADVYRSLGLRGADALTLRSRMDRNAAQLQSNTLLAGRLDITSTSLGSARESAQEVLDLAIGNSKSATLTAGELQAAASAALDRLTMQFNTSYGGATLFAGTATDVAPMQPWNSPSATTGQSPRDVVEGVIGGGIGDAGDAQAKIDAMAAVFDGTAPGATFEGTFYNGTPLTDAGGAPSPRVSARIADGVTLEHGVQANDPAVRDMMRGLAMIAGTDVSQIADDQAYSTWMGEAVSALAGGIDGVLEAQTRLGAQQQTLERTIRTQEDAAAVFNNRVLDLEGVDSYEAATRVSALTNQLEATWAITSRLSRLSLLNFL